MVTFETVRELTLALPEADEGISYGTPAFRVKGRFFARLREDGESLVVRVNLSDREALLAEEPETFSVMPHYQDYPLVLVDIANVDPEHLRELLIEAWRHVAPKRLAAAYDTDANRTPSR